MHRSLCSVKDVVAEILAEFLVGRRPVLDTFPGGNRLGHFNSDQCTSGTEAVVGGCDGVDRTRV